MELDYMEYGLYLEIDAFTVGRNTSVRAIMH